MTDPQRSNDPGAGRDPSETSDIIFNSEDLLRGQREIKISHEGETYRLLVTRNGKLMLQK